ncbi:flagellar type III secretion system pore protein FliP [Legionella sp. CNM-4043-24]|uniref:flagellar type III secretion system pore protein FliP n=1 Tax=Legionella sp. CNM-4043-24 TaxID=3421646 RepID=UPI00403ABFDF
MKAKLMTSCLTALMFLGLMYMTDACASAPVSTPTIPLLTTSGSGANVTYSLSIKILAVMAMLSVLPALLITTSAFTRIIIVFAILRQALGVPNVPSNQILLGLALIMTIYIMMPTLEKINETSIQPYMQGSISESQALQNSGDFIKQFMFNHTRKADLNLFTGMAHKTIVNNDYPLFVLMPAYITSELKTAFQIGFLIFLPFLIIDLVTASVLMSMGMMMLSPMVISLPFKILFFVLVDGWVLIVTSLVTSFRV